MDMRHEQYANNEKGGRNVVSTEDDEDFMDKEGNE